MNASELDGIKFGKVTVNSKKTGKGDCFVAVKGEKSDGHDFVADALARGASYCIVQRDIWDKKGGSLCDPRVIKVPDSHYALSYIAARSFGDPGKKLKVIGITGTNGKTTTSFLIEKIISDMGVGTGMIGTVIYKIGDEIIEADRTTPDAVRLNELLSKMAEKKITYSVMEISSHALDQYRAGHVPLLAAIFTNLTPEHLDYHKTMEEYFKAKAKIFDNLVENGTAVINIDDEWAPRLEKAVKQKILTYGLTDKAFLHPRGLKLSIEGTSFNVDLPGGSLRVRTKLIGLHNVSNILAAIGAGYACGFDMKKLEKSIESFKEPPGRLESISSKKGFKVFVDYAHTKDALSKAITALRPYAAKRLITVFGCGGDRDRTKRPEMGKVTAELSDAVIITSDNPRSEDPAAIIKEIEAGIDSKNRGKCRVISDRRDAIKEAVTIADKGDIVLIAGKGHETYQIIGDKILKFDDREVAREFLSLSALNGAKDQGAQK